MYHFWYLKSQLWTTLFRHLIHRRQVSRCVSRLFMSHYLFFLSFLFFWGGLRFFNKKQEMTAVVKTSVWRARRTAKRCHIMRPVQLIHPPVCLGNCLPVCPECLSSLKHLAYRSKTQRFMDFRLLIHQLWVRFICFITCVIQLFIYFHVFFKW